MCIFLRVQNGNNRPRETRIVRGVYVDYQSLQHNFSREFGMTYSPAENCLCLFVPLNSIYAMSKCYRVPETLPTTIRQARRVFARHIPLAQIGGLIQFIVPGGGTLICMFIARHELAIENSFYRFILLHYYARA